MAHGRHRTRARFERRLLHQSQQRESMEFKRWLSGKATLDDQGCLRKARYKSEAFGEKVRQQCLKERPHEPLRLYLCPYCGWWHLTSQPLRTPVGGPG